MMLLLHNWRGFLCFSDQKQGLGVAPFTLHSASCFVFLHIICTGQKDERSNEMRPAIMLQVHYSLDEPVRVGVNQSGNQSQGRVLVSYRNLDTEVQRMKSLE